MSLSFNIPAAWFTLAMYSYRPFCFLSFFSPAPGYLPVCFPQGAGKHVCRRHHRVKILLDIIDKPPAEVFSFPTSASPVCISFLPPSACDTTRETPRLPLPHHPDSLSAPPVRRF
jgi:hypothetical protein